MDKFPVDAPIEKVLKSLEMLGFVLVREGNHIAMIRKILMVQVLRLRCQTTER